MTAPMMIDTKTTPMMPIENPYIPMYTSGKDSKNCFMIKMSNLVSNTGKPVFLNQQVGVEVSGPSL